MQKLLLLLLLSFSLFAGEIHYYDSYDEALRVAKKEHKPLILFMTQHGCRACKFMKTKVLPTKNISQFINKNYIIAQLDVRNNMVPDALQVHMTPTFHFITPDAKKFHESIIGGKNADDFYSLLVQAKNLDYFYATVVEDAQNSDPIFVKDTDSALGRYNLQAKPFGLDTLVKAHGHLCDGIVIAYVEITQGLQKLFPNGITDRTDIRIVARNSPCLVDGAALMTGARINFKTLSLDNSLGLDFIIQRISTGESVRVSLKDPSFLKALKSKERSIKKIRHEGKNVTPADIDRVEALAQEVIRKMLDEDAEDLVEVNTIKNYQFTFSTKDFGKRTDTINKNMPR